MTSRSFVDETLFASRSQPNMSGPRAGATTVLSSGDIHRITKTIRGPKPSGPSGKAAQHSHSVQRAAKWGNTIHAQSQKKIQDKVDTEAIAEAERCQIDADEAAFRAAQRQQAIDRANQMLYQDTDKIRSFNSKLMIQDVVLVREAQVEHKKKKDAAKRHEDDHYVAYTKEFARKVGEAEMQEADERKLAALKNQAFLRNQVDGRKSAMAALTGIKAVDKSEAIAVTQQMVEMERATQNEKARAQQACINDRMTQQKTAGMLKQYESRRGELEAKQIVKYTNRKEELEVERQARLLQSYEERESRATRARNSLEKKMQKATSDENAQIEAHQRAVQAKRDQMEGERDHRRMLATKQMKHVNGLQISEKRQSAKQEFMTEMQFAQQLIKHNEDAIREDEEAAAEAAGLRKTIAGVQKAQGAYKAARKVEDREQEVLEAAYVKQMMEKEEDAFRQYAQDTLEHSAATGKIVEPILSQFSKRRLGNEQSRAVLLSR